MAADAFGSCVRGSATGAGDDAPTHDAAALVSWDRDGSGRLDRPAEVRAVPCGVWRSWSARMQRERNLGLSDAWGLRDGMVWAAEGVGLDERVRRPLRRTLRRCGVGQPTP